MYALSIRQPWAWLIANSWKNIENRTWHTFFRGRFLIHASKGMTRTEWFEAAEFVRSFAPDLVQKIPDPNVIERGGIVGEVNLVDCVTHHNSHWFCGPYGFVLKDARPLKFWTVKGSLGFFDLPEVNPG